MLWIDNARRALGPLFDDSLTARRSHSLDAWPLAQKRVRIGMPPEVPAAVAFPRSTQDVSLVIKWAAGSGVPITPWGGGSSVTGSAMVSSPNAMVVDLTGLNRVLNVDRVGNQARVEAGVVGSDLERTLASHGATTWFAPQSIESSTVGGWVATRATGQFSSRWGGIEQAVASLRVVLADGKVVDVGSPPRGAVGPDLKSLFIGSEGTLGVITEVVLRIHPLAELTGLEAYALPGIDEGLAAVRNIMQSGLAPALLRLYDADEAKHLEVSRSPLEAVLLVGFGGVASVAAAERKATTEIVSQFGASTLGAAPAEAWMRTRNDFSRVEQLLEEPGGYAETIEIADSWTNINSTYREMKAILAPLCDEVLGHFSHHYTDGTSLYLITVGRAIDDHQAVLRLEDIWEAAMTTALRCGAVIAHHHGIGQARARFLDRQLLGGSDLLSGLKRALDPNGVFHSGGLSGPRGLSGAS